MISRKTCTSCGKALSLAAFNGSARSPDGLARMCRACVNARRRERDGAGVKQAPSRAASTILATALRKGDIKTVRMLFRAGMNPRWDWVCETMRGGHRALAEWLLESGVERNIFAMAAIGDKKELTRRLRRVPADARLSASMEPASTGVTPLHVGCASNWMPHGKDRMTAQVQVAHALHKHGADLNASARYRGIEDATPLLCACWSSENRTLVDWLLDHGAVATEAHLWVALGHLQRHGRRVYDIAGALVASGVPVDGTVRGARTPLQAFAHQATHSTVAWLIAHGADVNARGPGGRAAAHFAAERNTGPMTLALLVESGADLTARDEDGRTPLEIARLNGKTRLVEWIAKRIRESTGEANPGLLETQIFRPGQVMN
jgi:hypothetical protein